MLDFTNKTFLQTFIWRKATFFPGFYIRFHEKTFIKTLIFKIFFSAWSGRLAQKQARSVPVRHSVQETDGTVESTTFFLQNKSHPNVQSLKGIFQRSKRKKVGWSNCECKSGTLFGALSKLPLPCSLLDGLNYTTTTSTHPNNVKFHNYPPVVHLSTPTPCPSWH